jgi:hypothetical protein
MRMLAYMNEFTTGRDEQSKEVYQITLWRTWRGIVNKQIGDFRAMANYALLANSKNYKKKSDVLNPKYDFMS